MIRTASELIDAVGGNAVVTGLTGRRSPAISNWRKRNRIPAEFCRVLEEAAAVKGEGVSPVVFGMPEMREAAV